MHMHIDDLLCTGSREDLDKLHRDIHRKYKITMLGQWKEHLGVHYNWRRDEFREQYVVDSMEKNTIKIVEYNEKVKDKRLN